jgi:hypothetical protein
LVILVEMENASALAPFEGFSGVLTGVPKPMRNSMT